MTDRQRISYRFSHCRHAQTLSVISEGVERVICEECGYTVVRSESMISGDVSRSKFSRRADRLHRNELRVPVSKQKP